MMVLAAGAVLLCHGACGAQRAVARTTAGPDSSQQFAAYYPTAYGRGTRLPALFIMDPRGRGDLALGLFRDAAEKYGYAVYSSFNTLSDGPLDPNVGAVNAFLAAVTADTLVDQRRLYLAGLSGTARIAWSFLNELPANFRGLLASGAAPMLDSPTDRQPLNDGSVALCMSVGDADFNFAEVHAAHEMLASLGLPVRVAYFQGLHGWPPAGRIDDALAWFELRAMLGGARPIDSAWVDTRFTMERARGDSLARAGQLAAAADAFSELARDSRGWPGNELSQARSRELEADPRVLHARRTLDELDRRDMEGNAQLMLALSGVRKDPTLHDPTELAARLGLPRLKQLAAAGDSLERPWATRQLARAQVFLAFYEPRAYLEQNEAARAVLMLRTAALIQPLGPAQQALLARAEGMLSRP